MRHVARLAALAPIAAALVVIPFHRPSNAVTPSDFVHFESGHVRPAALTPDGSRLLVVNTPDSRLSVFDLTGEAPVRVAEIPVGLEPISVACLDDGTAWVVNHLSDDVSVVDLERRHVCATLRVGDEPADVVFAGTPLRAFVSVSQEDRVRVYDPLDLAAAPVNVPIHGRQPRALARSADGEFVYAAVHLAGNRTSLVRFLDIAEGEMPLDPAFPRSSALGGRLPPRVGLIVQQQGGAWRDMYGNDWTARMPFAVSDVDVAEIRTATSEVTRTFGNLGTVNFALAVSPTDGRLALTATEARNLLRFEPRLRGHTVDTRLALLTPEGVPGIRELNPHIDYSVSPGAAGERDSALGTPTGVAFAPDGARVYVTSLASDRLGVVDVSQGAPGPPLARETGETRLDRVPRYSGVIARVPTVAGPTGVVVDGERGRLYVVGRMRGELQTFDAASLAPVATASIGFDPTPPPIAEGRRVFYGGFTSGHGDQSCASCHVFGDFDGQAWDLGDPAGTITHVSATMPLNASLEGFDPMKGPMTTQTLRGFVPLHVLHWRGDRTDLGQFDVAFTALLGRSAKLSASEMAAFSNFVNALAHPPSPHRHLDRSLPDAPLGQPSARRGEVVFRTDRVRATFTCRHCHTEPFGTNGLVQAQVGIDGDQDMKVPGFRNSYRKLGGTRVPGAVSKRGFSLGHDGEFDNLFAFASKSTFALRPGPDGYQQRLDLEAFMIATDTGIAPSVGRQLTFAASSAPAGLLSTLDTLEAQAALANCDLIARGRRDGMPRGWLFQGADLWKSDRASEPSISTAQLLALAGPGTELTVSGVPFGSGRRMAIDRDRDQHLDTDERSAGSDPGDPASVPQVLAVFVPGVGAGGPTVGPNPFREAVDLRFALAGGERVDATIHDLLGREVRVLARGARMEAGAQSLRWDGRDAAGRRVAAGVYFVRLAAGEARWTRTVLRVP